jgi:rfaE bifunctional protein nucleotidyltransferase chain/domain
MNINYLTTTKKESDIINTNNIDTSIEEFNTYKDYKNIVCIKPWGYEFLAYESKKIGIWFLKIVKGEGTSLHTHFKKDTFVIVVSGIAKVTLIDNEILSLGPMESVFIPKTKFHALSSFSDEVFLIEIEIFDKEATFSNKNDLLRIDDKYNRKRTGYTSSISISTKLQNYDYFYLNEGLQKKIHDTLIKVIQYDEKNIVDGYNIILDGEIYVDGLYLKEGSFINNLNKKSHIIPTPQCLILQISNMYYFEDSKIIYSLEQLSAIVKKLKNNNMKIVLTSGCYDIIHVGHIHHLKEAKKQGDVLIACLSSDEQITKLKGENRPINKYIDRINLFKTIGYIDYIVLYNEEDIEKELTLDKIMRCVSPYCWVKGSDYTVEKIMEKHPHLNNIVLIENIKDKSTTNIINEICSKSI